MCIDLIDKIRALVEEGLNNENYIELIDKCREIIIEYKNNGGKQKDAYNTLIELHKLYDEKNMEKEYNLIGDVLDIIVGYVGNKKILIWEEYLKT
ncbi:MAG: hypothetical protein LBM00_09835 [Deltaproteobacteria bacterium]|jgi:hypothetical protein|nr:hypothetical protein [Deltaproteobacteria bacterium]